MEKLTSAEFDTIYERVEREFEAMKARMEAQFSERYSGDRDKVVYAMYGAFSWKLLESLVAFEVKRELLDRTDRKLSEIVQENS